jgi:hypothetical protein
MTEIDDELRSLSLSDTNFFEQLPRDAIIYILQFLDVKQILEFSQLSKYLKKIADESDDVLWVKLCHPSSVKPIQMTWKAFCKDIRKFELLTFFD